MFYRYATRLTALAVLAVLIAAPVWAQQREAVMLHTSPPPAYSPERGGDIEEIHRYDPNEDQAISGAKAGGYVFGTNGYDDLGKSVSLDLPDGWTGAQILGFSIAIFRAASPTLSEFRLAAYTGDETVGPQEEIDGQNFPMSDIDQAGPAAPLPVQQFVFDEPIEVDGTFHAAVTWGSNADAEDLGMAHSPGLLEHSPYEWELWTTKEGPVWNEVASAWGTNGWHVWIGAVVQELGVSGEPGAEAQEITISSVYPNPVATQSSVDITTDRPQHVSVEVFNLLGQRVMTVYEGSASAGTSVLPINGAELAAGMYIVRLQGEDFTQSRKFVVAN